MGLVLPGGLCGACWLYPVQELLIEPSICACAVLPILKVILQLVRMEILSVEHLAVLPFRLIAAALAINDAVHWGR